MRFLPREFFQVYGGGGDFEGERGARFERGEVVADEGEEALEFWYSQERRGAAAEGPTGEAEGTAERLRGGGHLAAEGVEVGGGEAGLRVGGGEEVAEAAAHLAER